MTRKAHRGINITFNAGLMIEDVGSDDRLQFVVKDVCVLQESRVGHFGPKAAPPSGERVAARFGPGRRHPTQKPNPRNFVTMRSSDSETPPHRNAQTPKCPNA